MDFGVFEPSEFVYGMLWSIALNPALMIVIWFFLLILGYCWSGLRNLVRILLFPGMLIHMASHMLFARLKGMRMRFIAMFRIGWERSVLGVILTKEHPVWIFVFAMFPALVAIPLYIIFLNMAILFRAQTIFAMLFLWLAVSIFIEGIPSIEDMGMVLKASIYYEPLSIIFLALTPIVFTLNTYGFGISIGIYITLFYVIAIMFLSLVCRRERVEVYGA